MGSRFDALSPLEQAAVTAFVRGEFDRVVFQRPACYISKNAQTDPERWQDSLREVIASDPLRVRAIVEAPAHKANPKSGFTLIELSIVLVIIGLIVGGVLAGQSLIRAAELQSVLKDLNRFTTAVYTFRDKYNALPGDMTNATDYWGANPNCAANGAGTGTQTCNGNGNGAVDTSQEIYWFWQHLGNAGLIEGSYNGVNGIDPNLGDISIPGHNVPASKISGAGWTVGPPGDISGSIYWLDQNYTSHMLMFGTPAGVTGGAIISAAEAFSVDKKIDDGLPGSGTVMGWKAAMNPGCLTTDVAATAAYQIAAPGHLCALIFETGF